MADAAAVVDPAERGTLDVRVKTLERIVEQVVLETPGTVRHRSALRSLARSGTPRASTSVHAGSARLDVHVSCAWPCAVTHVVTEVRDRVLAEAARLTGIDIRSVDVTVEVIRPDGLDDAASRRVQ